MSIRIRSMMQLNLGLARQQIVGIEGRTVFDSSLTSTGSHMMRIMLTGCTNVLGDHASASGLVSVLGDRKEIISSGTVVHLAGRFSDSLFIYDSIQVVGRRRINEIRERMVSFLEYRLASLGHGSSTLSALLLFGRSDYAKSPMRELAQSCGCAHILALSGMHLGIIASGCRRLFGDKWLGKAVSAVMVALFVFAAGPRPSLVRAMLSFALGFVDIKFRTPLVFLLQMVLFPASMTEVGCCYGYVAVFAIVYLYPLVKAVLFQFLGRACELVSASLSVMLLSAPFQMILTGRWHIAAIVASPIAAFLAACSMILGLLLLSLGQIPCLVWLNGKVYGALETVFTYFGSWPSSGWVGYVVLVSSLILLAGLLFVLRNRILHNMTNSGGYI